MEKATFQKRVYFTGFILVAVFLVFAVKLFNLHFSDRIIIKERKPLSRGRGVIYDRNGYILASSIEVSSVFADPSRISNPATVSAKLASVLNMNRADLFKRLSKKKKFVWLKRKCEEYTVNRIQSMKIAGIGFRKEYKRVYPYESLAGNILGFVGLDNKGLAGLEYKMDSVLSGRDEVYKNEAGRSLYRKKDIYLTIDRFVQYVAEEELKAAMEKHRAKQGAVVILDIESGKVLALAKGPGFDPNRYWAYSGHARKNFSVVDSYEPGSTLKVLAMASAIEHKPAILKKKFYCKGFIDIAGVRINCMSKHGEVGVADILKHSCNSGMIQAVQYISKKNLYDTYVKLGFGRKTGIELPGETEGILRPVSKWSGLSKSSMSIGQEISVTSIQMVAAFAAIANGGIYNIPTIISRIEHSDDKKVVKDFFRRTRGRVVRKDIAALLMEFMRNVVKDGSGHRASSKYYETLGKTGTSQKFARSLGEYSDRNISSFIGVAPYKNPKVCIITIIDDPEDRGTGGAAAAPVFAKIVNRILPYMGVGNSTDKLRIKKSLSPKKRIYQSMVWPNFSGMDLYEIRNVLGELHKRRKISYKISGGGRVFRQSTVPGKKINDNETVVLYMK